MTAFPALLDKLQRRIDLTEDEAAGAMETIMDGRAQPSQIAGLLIGLAMKGERPDEIVGLAKTMRARATKLSRAFTPVFDTCGTGGDGLHSFNVSTVAALVLAASGVRVAKHGNRSASSRCGSADLFETLGVNVAAPPPVIERCLDEAGIAFFFAQVFHPSMKHAAPTRKELGVRTAFNLLGPLTNPAGATRQLVGVNSRNLRTLDVEPDLHDRLASLIPADIVSVAESGLREQSDLQRLERAGYTSFLVGERLITQPDPGAALKRLRKGSA